MIDKNSDLKGSRKAPISCRQLLQIKHFTIKRTAEKERERARALRKSNKKRTNFYDNTTFSKSVHALSLLPLTVM